RQRKRSPNAHLRPARRARTARRDADAPAPISNRICRSAFAGRRSVVRAAKSRTEQSRKLIDQLEGEPAFGPLVAVLATTFDLTPDFVELDFLPSLVRVPAWDDRKVRARV